LVAEPADRVEHLRLGRVLYDDHIEADAPKRRLHRARVVHRVHERGMAVARITDDERMALDGWRNDVKPAVNGLPLKLDDYEISRSFALSPDDRMLVLGAEWAVRACKRDAQALWTTRMSGVVWQVAVSVFVNNIPVTPGA
jgi:hypothetical protein